MNVKSKVKSVKWRTQVEQAEHVKKEPAQSEVRLRSTLDYLLEACVILDFNWRYVYVNDAAVRLVHRSKEERIGRTLMEVFPGIEKQDTFAHLKKCMENRTPEQYETEFSFPEGGKAWFEIRVEPVPEGILTLYFDITERKRAELHLKRVMEQMQHLYGISEIITVMPVSVLMIEHRLIERAIVLLGREIGRMERTATIDPDFIGQVVQFIRRYADRTHHGKEEDILFKVMTSKAMSPEHKRIMDELGAEHNLARDRVRGLINARERWLSGDSSAVKDAIALAGDLVDLYPKHIEKEDRRFFPAAMQYLTTLEQDNMLREFWDFDRQLVHEEYKQLVEGLAKRLTEATKHE